jgi:pilus assembly protein HofO
MGNLAERWCDLSRTVRLSCGLLMVLLAGLLCGYAFFGREAPPAATEFASHWRKLLALKHSLQPVSTEEARPFSAMDFQTDGCQLVSWQPGANGGELVLSGQWRALTKVFSLLANQDMHVTGFSMAPEKQSLKLMLQLEANPHG